MDGSASCRPRVSGKFLKLGEEKFYIRGVTYGTFEPRLNGEEYPEPDIVEKDFTMMATYGFNAIRTYTPPPIWLLDLAAKHDLHVMVGIPMERYTGYLAERKDSPDLEEIVRKSIRQCAGHPAVLAYSVGNEIPASVVRWIGRRKIERFLFRLYQAAKKEDPGGLVTYVNYPSTEYLNLPFLDLISFNVYLEAQERLSVYLPKLQTIAGDRPLIMSEVGIDSLRNGLEKQADVLEWQLKTAFHSGCAGAFVYSWTDQWYRSGEDVLDWNFGLTTRDRDPKPALHRVSQTYSEIPLEPNQAWPMISVVVCTYNGSRTLQDTVTGLKLLEYPDYEVIIVDNGSTDGLTSKIAQESGFRVIRTPQTGLSAARNVGIQEATGEIIAYIDDDARPDPHWLQYLASTFVNSTHCGIGGPNLPPAGDGLISECLANAPGGPIQVFLTDQIAEHIPGCNMAFRKICLEEVGGFDPQFRVAGDDVDICWRLQAKGWTIGFNPAALVWHHRRNSILAFLKQQRGYGRAEALLASKWPEKYNRGGHIIWAGRLYGKGLASLFKWSSRVYHGVWGLAPFQSIYEPTQNGLSTIPLMPEWFFVTLFMGMLAMFGLIWKPLLLIGLPLFLIAASLSFLQAGIGAGRAIFTEMHHSSIVTIGMRLITGFLFLVQPLARLYGRLEYERTSLRWHGPFQFITLWPHSFSEWFEKWQSVETRLEIIEKNVRMEGATVRRGGNFDPWDLEVRGGLFGSARMIIGIEEFGGGKQLVRYRIWPRISRGVILISIVLLLLSYFAVHDGIFIVALFFDCIGVFLLTRMLLECTSTMALIRSKCLVPKLPTAIPLHVRKNPVWTLFNVSK